MFGLVTSLFILSGGFKQNKELDLKVSKLYKNYSHVADYNIVQKIDHCSRYLLDSCSNCIRDPDCGFCSNLENRSFCLPSNRNFSETGWPGIGQNLIFVFNYIYFTIQNYFIIFLNSKSNHFLMYFLTFP